MAFLSPKITEAILTGQQSVDLSIAKLTRMLDLPVAWREQQAVLMGQTPTRSQITRSARQLQS